MTRIKNPMGEYTAQDHRRRLENIRYVEKNMKSYVQRNMIYDYIPGQYTYQQSAPAKDVEEDKEKFKKLRDAGVGLIQTWSTWCTPESRWTGDRMYVPDNADATRKFIDLVHDYDMKILPYTCSNFMERYKKPFSSDWAYNYVYDLGFGHKSTFDLAHCSPTSPGWREQMLKQFVMLLDEFDYDGVYIDSGYSRRSDFMTCHRYYFEEPPIARDDVLAFREEPKYDGGMEDFIGMIYNEVHRRGGILKMHKEGADTLYSDMKIYDYLWVGEAVQDMEYLRHAVKEHRPYLIPDFNYKPEKEVDRYINAIPYMQFPLLRDGNIGIDSNMGVTPDFDLSLEWLKLYKEMATESAWCYVDAKVPDLVKINGGDVVTTFYANYDLYLVVANYAQESADIVLKDDYVEVSIKGEKPISKAFTLDGRDMKILKKVYDPSKSVMPDDVPTLYLLSQEDDMTK